MVPLTATDKKLLKQITSFPWPADLSSPVSGPVEEAEDDAVADVLNSYASLEDQLRAAVEQQRRLAPQQIANLTSMRPGMSETQLRNMLTDTCLCLSRVGEAGIARRFLRDDPEELIRFGVVGTRMKWVVSGHGRRDCAGMWGVVLAAMAIGDDLALDRMLGTLPLPLGDDQAYPYPTYYPRLYNAVLSLVRGDPETARSFIDQLQPHRLPENEGAIVTCLRGILDRSPELVAEGMQTRAVTVRKIKTADPHFKLFDGTLHCLYQLCQRIDADLTKLWDTGQRLPWDAEYHERLQAGGDPMGSVDLSGLPERNRMLLVELPIPDWWSALP